ncbi:hypothetical protein HPB49_006240 [Dermacentor silvarum]|uniref:Uncharacterized protein n=1 Tax=Dermacentor silvarum TaxID=543639 RepID=A0ACB8CQG0_DERSI|nr:hypothetical protein HPB49_006240 [Dermacentor silvarum]
MKISTAIVVCLVSVLAFSRPDVCEAKLGLALAPFVWASNLAKDATRTLVAYKLSLATKALAMITGNHSFRATIAYDSQLERYEDAPAAAVDDGVVWGALRSAAAITAAPSPVQVENEVKVEWLPSVTKPVIHLPTLPPMPQIVVPSVVVPKVVVPKLPRIMVPKLIVPKIVMTEIAVPGVVQSKVDLLTSKINKLSSKSAALLGGPKYASGYIKGGFRVGSGAGPVADEQLTSLPKTTPVSAVEPRYSTVVYKNTQLERNATTDSAPVNHSRLARSVDAGVMGRYFRFIQANDEGRCVAFMVCSMAAHPQQFGVYGRKVVDFFDDVKPSALSPMAPYKEASSVGRSGDSCRSRYSACQVDPKYLARLGESHVPVL